MGQIQSIHARQIFDSRGNPTVEVDLFTNSGVQGRAAVPSGASTGSREALELRDNRADYFLGKSVLKAVENINVKIAPALIGKDVRDQRGVDQIMLELDGTPNKEVLGANAILAVSLAAARAGAADAEKPLFRYLSEDLKAPQDSTGEQLPTPLMNIINGGGHASNGLDLQEFMITPVLKGSFSDKLRAGVEIFHHLKKILSQKGFSTNVGDEGGFAPNLSSNEEAIECIVQAVEAAGYKMKEQILLSFDCAASEFYDNKKDVYSMSGKDYNAEQLIDYYGQLCEKYPVFSIEDGLDESDYENWSKLTKRLGSKILSVGDDLFVTNKKLLATGIEKKQANAILVKLNQIGSLSETFDTLELAFKNQIKAIISHRSGETSDTFIADLSVATRAGLIKTGSASRSDRMEKYNQLLRIEEALR